MMKLDRGYYVYVGSALGENVCIERRVLRHRTLARRKTGRLRWHIDYLLACKTFRLVEAIPVESSIPVECVISKGLEVVAEGVVAGFGSSDCRSGCKGHLYYFKKKPSLQTLGFV